MDKVMKDFQNVNLRGGRSKRSIKIDRSKRSKQGHERGRGAPRKSNPRYKPVRRKDKNGVMRKVYILRKK